jgi:hypothetical protein
VLADEIAEGCFDNTKFARMMPRGGSERHQAAWHTQCARHAQVIRVDNIVDYLEDRMFGDGVALANLSPVTQLPCVAAPFPIALFEAYGFREKHSASAPRAFRRFALLVGSRVVDDEVRAEMRSSNGGYATHTMQSARWVSVGHLFIQPSDQPAVLIGFFVLPIAADGHPMEGMRCDLVGDRQNPLASIVIYCSYASLLATSFMHCKNVVQRTVDPPAKLSKRHRERHGRPLFSYRVLEIEPMKQVLRTEGRVDEVGLVRALHICRGHFKDYREHGLFGRNKGLYWWDQHVRGSVAAGVAAKDYSVSPPNGAKPDGAGGAQP